MNKLKCIKVPIGSPVPTYQVRVTKRSKNKQIGELMTEKEADELIEFIESAPSTIRILRKMLNKKI